MVYRAAILDFDGTVARTEEGITRSVAHALNALGKPVPDAATLRRFIGPPLYASCMDITHLSPDEAERAVALYRERYGTVGLYEAEIYSGLPEMLVALRAEGMYTCVASGKPEAFLRRIIARFEMEALFDAVAGPDPGSHSADKSGEILRALPAGVTPAQACMVGDRRFDIESGKKLGMTTVGVTWGYGDREELQRAGADFIVEDVARLTALLRYGDQ